MARSSDTNQVNSDAASQDDRLAPLKTRAIARLHDNLVFAFICFLFCMAFMVCLATNASPVLISIVGYTGTACALGYLLVADALFSGQSVGKWLFGIQVVKVGSDTPCTLSQSIARNVWVLLYPTGLGFADILFIVSDSQRRRFGDRVAGTEVISVPRQA
jgi:uncharacterized RDD family membrane protein YckC